MMQKIVSLLVLSITSLQLHAVTLPPVQTPKDNPVPVPGNSTPIPCDQIVARLAAYNQMAVQHESSLTSFLSDVGQKVSLWYTQLQPLEGTAQTLPVGTFSVLQDGGDKISQITDMAYDNTDLLSGELNNIITSLKSCTIK